MRLTQLFHYLTSDSPFDDKYYSHITSTPELRKLRTKFRANIKKNEQL